MTTTKPPVDNLGIFGDQQEAAPVMQEPRCFACTGIAPLPPGPIHVPSCHHWRAEAAPPDGYRAPAGHASEEPEEPPSPAQGRRALRRLSNTKPDMFEQVVDLMYEWREHAPGMHATEMFRRVFYNNQNITDDRAVQAMTGLIKEVRHERIKDAINRLGLEEAEKLLGVTKAK